RTRGVPKMDVAGSTPTGPRVRKIMAAVLPVSAEIHHLATQGYRWVLDADIDGPSPWRRARPDPCRAGTHRDRGARLSGYAPRLAVAGWAALAFFVVLGEIGPLLSLNQWVMDVSLSLYIHVPKLPGQLFHLTPLVLLTALAVVLVAV